MPRPLSLTAQNALRLALVFLVFEAVVGTAVVGLLMWPMARSAAGDLASLMVLSAQTWSELPPETRPAFAQELAEAHALALRGSPPEAARPIDWHGPFAEELEADLGRRSGQPVVLASSQEAGRTWHWAALPSGGRTLWIGFPHDRVGTQPLAAALLVFGAGVGLAILAAWWLAVRTVAPLKRFDAAAAALGQGVMPALLPESGPRELAALAQRFNRLARQVQDLLEARTTLLAGLSHDLRTPLARMRLALEMLERRPDPAWIHRLDTDIGEMDRLVGDMLDLARGLGSEEPVPVDLGALAEELAARAREGGAQVELRAVPVVLDLPETSLRRVLGNLLANALRYGAGQPLELRLEQGGAGWRIGILDRGPGIPEDQLAAVFRPFHRVDASRNPVTGGTGLGLAIVRQLAQANGWQVNLENRPGGGLAAWLSLGAAVASPGGRD